MSDDLQSAWNDAIPQGLQNEWESAKPIERPAVNELQNATASQQQLTVPEQRRIKKLKESGWTDEQVGMYLANRPERGIGNVPKIIGNAAYSAGGAATDLAAKVLPPERAAAVGVVANAGVQAIPMLINPSANATNSVAQQFGAKAARSPLRTSAEWLMRNAIGSSKKSSLSGNSDIAVKEMLDRGVNVSQDGVDKLSSLMDDVENKISTLAAQYPKATVNKQAVASRIIDEIARIEKTNPTPSVARKAAEGIYDEFISNPLVADNIPVAAAQQFKRGIYASIRDHYGLPTHMPQKALGRGFKEELENAIPGIDKLNAEQQKLIITLKETASRAATEKNKLPVSPFSAISASTGNPQGIALAVAYHAERSAAFRSVLARILNASQDPTSKILSSAAIAAQQKANTDEQQ